MQMQLQKRREDGKIKVRKEKGRTKDEKNSALYYPAGGYHRAAHCAAGAAAVRLYLEAGQLLCLLLCGQRPAEPAHHLRHYQQQKQPRLQDRVAHPHPAVPGLWGTGLPAVWLGQDRPLPAQKAAGHRHRDGQRHRRGAPALGCGAAAAGRGQPVPLHLPLRLLPALSEHHHRVSSARRG